MMFLVHAEFGSGVSVQSWMPKTGGFDQSSQMFFLKININTESFGVLTFVELIPDRP